MKVLILENDPISPAGTIAERIAARGGAMDKRNSLHGDALPESHDGYEAAVILGGAMSANDDGKFPNLAPMRDLLREFHGAGKPLLGVCLGAQILARCFGKTVRRHRELEFGYVPLTRTSAADNDALLHGLPQPPIMQFHEDTFDIPDEGEQLLAGARCVNQAYRVGRSTYAFQCHFEATQPIINQWMTKCDSLLRHRLGEEAEALLTATRDDDKKKSTAQRRFAETITDRWIDLIGA